LITANLSDIDNFRYPNQGKCPNILPAKKLTQRSTVNTQSDTELRGFISVKLPQITQWNSVLEKLIFFISDANLPEI
jgi:hypothetical protein